MDKRMTYGGNGSHWDSCVDVHWDCKIVQLEAELARRDEIIKRLVDMCKTFAHYGEVTWTPMADNEPRFMECLRALMKEVDG